MIPTEARRLLTTVIPKGASMWGARMARLPWTRWEVKAHLMRRGRLDEARLLKRLEGEGPVA